jgi:hypothetical protein
MHEPPRMHNDRKYVTGEGDAAWADEQIKAMLESGAIRPWDEIAGELRQRGVAAGPAPHCVSPIIVHDKPSSTPECRKRRFIHNLKVLNEHITDVPCGLESMADFVKQVRANDYMWLIDLKNAYFHVSVHWRSVTYLGFWWGGRYYCFVVLPFGLKTSAAAFPTVAAVPARRLRELGLVEALLWYMDDFCGDVGQVLDYGKVKGAVALFVELGFALNPEKLELVLSRVRQALGYVLDTKNMRISLAPRRRSNMIAAVERCVANQSGVTAREVARVVGHTMSASLVYGLWARMLSSYLILWVARAAQSVGYDQAVPLLGRALDEMFRWQAAARVDASRSVRHHARAPDWVLECDAWDSAVACIVTRCPEQEAEAWLGQHLRREL